MSFYLYIYGAEGEKRLPLTIHKGERGNILKVIGGKLDQH